MGMYETKHHPIEMHADPSREIFRVGRGVRARLIGSLHVTFTMQNLELRRNTAIQNMIQGLATRDGCVTHECELVGGKYARRKQYTACEREMV